MIPLNKFDIEAIEKLESSDESEVVRILPDLIPWLADCNWPIFGRLCKRLSVLGNLLSPELKKVLNGSDTILKANVVGHLFPLLSDEQLAAYRFELNNICTEAKMEDVIEGLVDYAEIQLSRFE